MAVLFDVIMLSLIAASLLLWGILAWQWCLLRRIVAHSLTADYPKVESLILFYTRRIYFTTLLWQCERSRLFSYALCQILPLQGLLGTVIGMIDIFNALTDDQQTSSLQQGISLALLSTFAGLASVIPAIFCLSYLDKCKETCLLNIQVRYSIGQDD